MAVFLTIVLVQAMRAGETGLDWSVAGRLVWPSSASAGWRARRRLRDGLPSSIALDLAQALYPLLASALALLVFAATTIVRGGSGFLAIYVAGLVIGNPQVHSRRTILRVHDGLAWLAQIGMFLVLGLLATPATCSQSRRCDCSSRSS